METLELQNMETEWMDLKTAAKYLNVNYKTLMTFRAMGLEVGKPELKKTSAPDGTHDK